MGNSDSLAGPVKLRFLISTSYPPVELRQGSPVFIFVWLPLRVTPITPKAHLSVLVVIVKVDATVFPLVGEGQQTPSCISRLHLGSLMLRPAGLLDSLTEPLSGNLMLQVTLNTSLQLHGRTTELPSSDFNRLVIRFTRHTTVILNSDDLQILRISSNCVSRQVVFFNSLIHSSRYHF